MNKFCSRPSRVFSGEVAALFAPDAQLYSVSTILNQALNSPFEFHLDTEIAQYSQFWNLTKFQLQIFAKTNGLNNWILSHVDRFWLCPNGMVGSNLQNQVGGLGTFQPQNVGIPLEKTSRQSQGNTLAIMGVEERVAIIVPPGWFIRYQIIDQAGGPGFLPAGTKITLTMLRQIIPANFVDLD